MIKRIRLLLKRRLRLLNHSLRPMQIYLRIRLNLLALKVYKKGLVSIENALDEKVFFLAAVAIFRGEDRYLEEWLEFHLLMGVEHFFLYDNGLEKSSKKILQPYIDKGLVTHIPWPDLPGLRDNNWLGPATLSIQHLAYGNCVRRYRHNFKWLLQIDLDEFMYPASPKYKQISEVLKTLDADKILGIMVPSLNFGSSGHIERPKGLVIENFTWSNGAPANYPKSIAHSKYLSKDLFVNPHRFRFSIWREWQAFFLGYPKVIRGTKANELLLLNHYIVKSKGEYLEKGKINAKGYMSGKENLDLFHELDNEANKVENFDIQRFLPSLKDRYEKQTQLPQQTR